MDPVETEKAPEQTEKSVLIAEQYKMGFFECLTETMQYLVEGHGYSPGHGLCLSLINHLQNHCAQIIKGNVHNLLLFVRYQSFNWFTVVFHVSLFWLSTIVPKYPGIFPYICPL